MLQLRPQTRTYRPNRFPRQIVPNQFIALKIHLFLFRTNFPGKHLHYARLKINNAILITARIFFIILQ